MKDTIFNIAFWLFSVAVIAVVLVFIANSFELILKVFGYISCFLFAFKASDKLLDWINQDYLE